jgi:translation initiation factor IF-3
VNRRIRVPQVRVIDLDGAQIGVMPTRDALRLAESKGYDLVEVSPETSPPVCKIMDYGKYKYELSKKARGAKKKQMAFQLKEMRLRPKIEEHDYQFKCKHVREFLTQGNKVKILVEFRGREMTHREFGQRLMERLQKDLEDVGTVGQRPKMEGRSLTMTLMPRPLSKKE